MKFQFGNEVLVLPGAVLSHADADAVQLRVLLWLASDPSLAAKPRQLAKLADCDVKRAEAALEYWQSCGLLCGGDAIPAMAAVADEGRAAEAKKADAASAGQTDAPRRTLVRRAEELPTYSSTELAELLEKRATLRAMVNEAQQILGKMFNPSEVNILVTMFDYLGLTEEGILLLLSHCRRVGKLNLRAIEKYAYSLVDRGITATDALEEEFRTVEALHCFEGEVRTLFGMKNRTLTSKEEKMLRAWVSYGYDIEIVRHAYEITVNATSSPSVPYTHKILERWHSEGLNTLAEIEGAEAAARDSRDPSAGTLGNSFDTDDLFRAALERSFRETGAKDDSSAQARKP